MPDLNWSEAFAALPAETPEPLGWERLQARLSASTAKKHRSWPRWLAVAAALALVAAIPMKLLQPSPAPAAKPQPTANKATTAPAESVRATTAQESRTETPVPAPSVASHPSPAPRLQRMASIAKTEHAPTPRNAAASDALEPLYRQSAQLEALLALARDDQVAGGVSTALSDDLGARMSRIDERLSQGGLQPQQRAALWHQRIDTLQQLVGIAATDRLYSARGQRHDAALVSID